MGERSRCAWAAGDPLLIAYHDSEWGVPSFEDRHLFELLSLEGAQAGLSWLTILRKREGYRRAFGNFELVQIDRFTRRTVQALLSNPEIVRNRQKIESVISNAQAVSEVAKEVGSFGAYLWAFVNGRARQNKWRTPSEVPTETPQSRALSQDLRRKGFRFVGPTTCYAFMQAVGMVNDHQLRCFRYRQVKSLGR